VEPDYLPDSEVCFSHVYWTPFPPPRGGVGGISPLSPGGPGGEGKDNFCIPPPWGIRGKAPEGK
jgi:hypothetical protein